MYIASMTDRLSPPLWQRDFTLIWAAQLILGLAFHSSLPAFPLLFEDRFGLSGLGLGAATLSYALAAVLMRPPAGFLVDRYGRRTIYLPGYLLFTLLYLAYPLADGAVSITLVRFVHGALFGIVMGATNTAAVDLLPPERRGEGIGYFGMAMILGMAAGPALGLLAIKYLGYDWLFRGAALFSLLGFGLALLLRFPDIPKSRLAFAPAALLEKTSLPGGLVALVIALPFGAAVNYSGWFARSVPGASAGTFYLLLALGTALTRLFSGRMFDRNGPAAAMAWGYALLLAGCLALAMSGISSTFAYGPLFFNAGGLLLGLGYGVSMPIIQAMVNALVRPERRGAANATMMTCFDVGICLGLLLASQLHASLGLAATYAALLGCVVFSALIFHLHALPRYRLDLGKY